MVSGLVVPSYLRAYPGYSLLSELEGVKEYSEGIGDLASTALRCDVGWVCLENG